jgi:hypothetical protein
MPSGFTCEYSDFSMCWISYLRQFREILFMNDLILDIHNRMHVVSIVISAFLYVHVPKYMILIGSS